MSGGRKKSSLLLNWCSHEAAKYAVEHWHYSRKMPAGKNVRIGVWEDEKFIGAVVFGGGTTPQIADPFGLDQMDVCELVRVALREHSAPVTRIVSIAIRLLRRQSPGLRLIVSYADPEMGHIGGIYQGGGWIYIGQSKGKWTCLGLHNRTFKGLRARVPERYRKFIREHQNKHKYVYPLDRSLLPLLETMRRPYPKNKVSASVAQGQSAAPTSAETAARLRPGRSEARTTG